MNKIYYLSTCDTCKRIITELQLKEKGFVFQDIKTEKIAFELGKENIARGAVCEMTFSPKNGIPPFR